MSEHSEPATSLLAPLALAADLAGVLDARLAEADAALVAGYPGDAPTRQPVHTVYVSGDQFAVDLPQRPPG